MKIAFLGLPLAACLLAADGHEIVLAGLCRPGPGRRRLRRLLGVNRVYDRPVLDDRWVDRMRREGVDLLVSWFWTNKIPAAVMESATRGGFGVHPSLLPRHRGPDPTTWAILSGDTITGVTAHRLAAEYDTGAILGRRELPIDPEWNAWKLAKALDPPSLSLLREMVSAFAQGDPPEQDQDETLATAAPFLDDDAHPIRWTSSAEEIVRQVRALAPSPGASMMVGDEVCLVMRARAVPAPAILEEPGESIVFDGRVLVRCADGAVEIVELELERDCVPLCGPELSALFAAPEGRIEKG